MSGPRVGRLLAALGAMAALAAASVAQMRLEQARLAHRPPSEEIVFVFLVAAVLAVFSTWGSSEPPIGQRTFRITRLGVGWYAGLTPGIVCLLAAAYLHGQPGYYPAHALTLALWAGGIGLLLVAGLAQHVTSVRAGARGHRHDWSRRSLLLSCLALLAVSIILRTVAGLEDLPAFVENDEATTGFSARQLLGENPYAWFGTWWVGIPNMSIVFTRCAELAFGESLWGIRMGGVVLGTLSVLCLFDFGRRLAGNQVALLAAILLAAAHVHMHWSRNGQIFIQTPAAAAVVMSLFVRAWTGGSLLSWVGAGVALGIGAQTYQASYVLPLLLLATAAGWALMSRLEWKGVVASVLLIEGVALLVLAPVATTMLRDWDRSASRPSTLSLFDPGNRRLLAERYGVEDDELLLRHVKRTAVMFNTGTDFYPNYNARRSFVDYVTAGMVPLAAAMLLVRALSPLGSMFWLWCLTYLALGVVLCAHPPAYHRIPTVLLFLSLAVSWAFLRLVQTIQAGFRLPRGAVSIAALAFALAAVAANADFYFREYRATRPTLHTAGYTWMVCRYESTHVVVDATILDGVEYVPGHNVFPAFECPLLRRVYSREIAKLWNVDALTEAEHAVLIVPLAVVEQHPGAPIGYRVTRHYVDDRIKAPARLPMAIYELERLSPSPN